MRRRGMVLAAAGATVAGLVAASVPADASAATPRPGSSLRLVAPQTAFRMTQSNNWSGYNQGSIEKGKQFTSISGTWTVPTATQHKAGQAEASATWVGIGGGCLQTSCTTTDQTLIQAGTGQDVSASGKKHYYAWYELIPAPSTTVKLPVAPGDTISVTIKQTTPATWSIVIRNASKGKSYSNTVPYSSTMGSAEWIEETPVVTGTGGTGIAKLPKLSTVHFRQATTNGAPAHLVKSERVQLVGNNGKVLATPSLPNATGKGFNDCTYASSCPAP